MTTAAPRAPAPAVFFRGGNDPTAAVVRAALAASVPGDARPRLVEVPAGEGCTATLPVVDASPLAARDTDEGVALMHAAAAAIASAPGDDSGDEPGCVVFLLRKADGPAAAAAIRSIARRVAPGMRANAVRIGRSPEDIARTVAFVLGCRSLTGQLIVLDPPYPTSVASQPDAGREQQPAPREDAALQPAALQTGGTREVLIRDLVLPCRVGVRRHERDAPQRVRINLKLIVDETPLRDRLEDVVCYDDVVDHIRLVSTGGHVNLVETLAERIADGCFQDHRVRSARVTVEKLDVYSDASAAGVRILRNRLNPF